MYQTVPRSGGKGQAPLAVYLRHFLMTFVAAGNKRGLLASIVRSLFDVRNSFAPSLPDEFRRRAPLIWRSPLGLVRIFIHFGCWSATTGRQPKCVKQPNSRPCATRLPISRAKRSFKKHLVGSAPQVPVRTKPDSRQKRKMFRLSPI